jgi:hypothetical protein
MQAKLGHGEDGISWLVFNTKYFKLFDLCSGMRRWWFVARLPALRGHNRPSFFEEPTKRQFHGFAGVVDVCGDDFCGFCHPGAQYAAGDEPRGPFWTACRRHDHVGLYGGFALHDEYFGGRLGGFVAQLSSGV